MNKIEIMVAGPNEQRLQTAASTLEANFTCIAVTAHGAEAAIEQFYRHALDIIILEEDMDATEAAKLKSLLGRQNSELVWVQRQSGDDLLHIAEQALQEYYAGHRTTFTVQDDVF